MLSPSVFDKFCRRSLRYLLCLYWQIGQHHLCCVNAVVGWDALCREGNVRASIERQLNFKLVNQIPNCVCVLRRKKNATVRFLPWFFLSFVCTPVKCPHARQMPLLTCSTVVNLCQAHRGFGHRVAMHNALHLHIRIPLIAW